MRNSWRDAKRGGEGDKQSLKKLKEDPETVIKRTLDTAQGDRYLTAKPQNEIEIRVERQISTQAGKGSTPKRDREAIQRDTKSNIKGKKKEKVRNSTVEG